MPKQNDSPTLQFAHHRYIIRAFRIHHKALGTAKSIVDPCVEILRACVEFQRTPRKRKKAMKFAFTEAWHEDI